MTCLHCATSLRALYKAFVFFDPVASEMIGLGARVPYTFVFMNVSHAVSFVFLVAGVHLAHRSKSRCFSFEIESSRIISAVAALNDYLVGATAHIIQIDTDYILHRLCAISPVEYIKIRRHISNENN